MKMMKKTALAAMLVFAAFFAAAQGRQAQEILDACNVQGGLIVVIDWDSPQLLAELRSGDSWIVQGLSGDPEKVAEARRYVQAEGLYGPVTVSRLTGAELPYVDNLVNVLVVAGSEPRITDEEMDRVLAPLGAFVDARQAELKVTRKPWPDALDHWTHYLYDASNHAVSGDAAVAPPRGLQWTCGPEYARSHEHFGSVSAMVSDAGRVFYIIDEGPISCVFLPPDWKLIARDAFSGVKLWELPIASWESQLRGFRSGPPEIGRRLIAAGERVFAALGYGDPVTILDAATGKKSRTLAATEGARELLCRDGVLYVLADDMTTADHEARKKWINETAPTLSGYQFPKRPLSMYGKQRIVALDTETGKPIWVREFTAPGELMPATMAVQDGHVCVQTVDHVLCLDASDGTDHWQADRPVARSRFSWSTPTLVIHGGKVLTVDRVASANADDAPPQNGSKWIMDNTHQSRDQDAELVCFSLSDGRELWRAPCLENYDTQLDIFVIDGVVWVGDLRHRGDPGFTEGRDLKTGKVVATIPHNRELYDLRMGHHRCYRNKATSRYLLLGRDGIEFVDPRNGTGCGNWWVRGTCQYGIMPANGLIYVPQHSCGCHPSEKLNGMNVLSHRSSAEGPAGDVEQLEKGPAYTDVPAADADSIDGDWPTYRRDARRSGFQQLPAPRDMSLAWAREFAAPVTAPVVAGGKVLFAETDRHILHALSADDGSTLWSFVADGRIDSPPSLRGGLCLFGTRNGLVYCLRASDGELAWRFGAAPKPRRLFSYEQLESVWPVHGSVLLHDDPSANRLQVCFAAGRSSHLDGGICLFSLDAKTGEVLHQAKVQTGAEAGERVIDGRALPDILSLQHGNIFMRDLGLAEDLAPLGRQVAHLYAPGGFLDTTWWHRTYWIYGTEMMSGYGGWPRVGNMVPAGRLLVTDGGERIFGYGRMTYRAGAGHVHPDATKDYKLFAEVLTPDPDPKDQRRGKGQAGRRAIEWSSSLPFVARSLVLAEDALLVAGGGSLAGNAGSHGPGILWIASREDGAKQAEYQLPASPVLDGAALTHCGLFLTTLDGKVMKLRTAKE